MGAARSNPHLEKPAVALWIDRVLPATDDTDAVPAKTARSCGGGDGSDGGGESRERGLSLADACGGACSCCPCYRRQ